MVGTIETGGLDGDLLGTFEAIFVVGIDEGGRIEGVDDEGRTVGSFEVGEKDKDGLKEGLMLETTIGC